MGAINKFFHGIGSPVVRTAIEFVTQGKNLGGANEEINSSSGTASFIESSINQNINIDWGDGTSDTFALTAGVAFNITGSSSGRKIYSDPFGFGVIKQVKVTFDNPEAITRFDATSWWLRGNLSTAIDILTDLVTLSLGNNKLDSIPANIINLNNLETLSLSSSPSLGGVIPNFIFGISSLKSFSFNNNTLGSLTYEEANYTRLPEFVNLETINFGSNGFTELPSFVFDIPSIINVTFILSTTVTDASIPANASSATTWRFYNSTVYRTKSLINAFIDSLYLLIITNAAISGSSSLPFRGMNINISNNALPTGVFQQPSGYSAGVSNGSPASQQEKIWVLVNQYGHLVVRATFTISSFTAGSSTQITLSNINPGGAADAQLQIGSVVTFLGVTGTMSASLNGINHTITSISTNTITISTDTTGLSGSGGNIYRVSY